MFAQTCHFLAKDLERSSSQKAVQKNESCLENWIVLQTLCQKRIHQANLFCLQVSIEYISFKNVPIL
jgi:hypothetical protein